MGMNARRIIALALAGAGGCGVVAGVAMIFVPAAVILGGSAVLALGIFPDWTSR